MWPTNSAKGKVWALWALKGLLLLAILAVGLSLRLDDLKVWKARQNLYFVAPKRPIFASYDAFYFARLARDWQEGRYRSGRADLFRGAPDTYLEPQNKKEKKFQPRYPFPVPLMSWSAAKLSDWLKTPLENVALYYTPITAVLFVIPLFFYLESLGYTAAGLLGGLVGATAYIYLMRTSIARFDTDSLNLFFPVVLGMCLWFSFRSPRSLLWVALASFFGFLFYWWYQHPHLVLVPYLLFVFLLWYERRKFGRKEWTALALLFLPNAWFLWQAPWNLGHQLYTYLLQIVSPEAKGLFPGYPNVQQSISELQKILGLRQAALFTLPNRFLFSAGLVGALILLWRERKALLYLWPYFLIGLLVFHSGNRFGMYLAPFLGMGLGFWVDWLSRRASSYFEIPLSETLRTLLVLLAVLILGAGILSSQKASKNFVATPKALAPIARDMEKLSRILPQGAWIWTWWDYGYAFQYYARRATFIDGGGLQVTPKSYYVALSWTSPSPETAHRVTHFLASKGLMGIYRALHLDNQTAEGLTRRVLMGPLFPPPQHPVYWVFTPDLFPKYGWIGYFGSWNFEKHEGRFGFILEVGACRRESPEILACSRGVRINLAARKVFLGNHEMPLAGIVQKTPERIREFSLQAHGLILEEVHSRYGPIFFLTDLLTYQSNFNQMYVLRRYNPSYFELVLDDFPFMVVYRTK
ncbi:hypothetical protein FVE67_00500 [Thermosulfurimonas marina]|uniref:Uncharacterized protein n=1 Tax=Thermosulfurimonas marina TaxID=2047767 RepID=A0A6H1WQC3_9BACT|nr:STT3 domain-containing protein [Thermosulfurimonas marina]QJA05358.1 hypothetical protein FVE67_00500 [Thermosulfurimonas marina]